MGKIISINAGFTSVYLSGPDRRYNAGDSVTLTDAEYAALDASLTRAVTLTQSGVVDPVRVINNVQSFADVSTVLNSLPTTYAPVNLGTRQSPIMSRKIRGGNIAPKPGGHAWKGLFAEWDWINWIKPQVDRAIALGLNAIRLIGGPECIFVAPADLTQITQAQYDAHWTQLATYCLQNGLYLYPCLVSKWDFVDVYGVGTSFTDATITASIKTSAANLVKFSNVIGFDLFQEGDSNTGVAWQASHAYSINSLVNLGGNSYKVTVAGTSASSGGPTGTGSAITDNTVTWAYQGTALLPSDVIAMMNAVRTVANVPLTMSRSLGDGFGFNDTISMWYTVFNTTGGADFVDLHIYLDNVLPGDPDFQILKAGKPFLIGEFGASQNLSGGTQTARYSALSAIHNRRGIIGSFVWALADQDTVSSNQWGVWDNTGFGPAFPAASTTPLSVTSGQRTGLTGVFPAFNVNERVDAGYRPSNLLTAIQARPRNVSTPATSGWTTGANTYFYAESRGLGFSATATGTTLTSTTPATSIPVSASTYYRANVNLLAGATARTVSMNVDWYDSGGAYLTSSISATGTDSTTIPLTLSLIVRSHASAVYGVIVVKVTDATQVANEAHIVLDAELIPA
jgi:hypothetical protein